MNDIDKRTIASMLRDVEFIQSSIEIMATQSDPRGAYLILNDLIEETEFLAEDMKTTLSLMEED
jgi:hypothetical protein